MRLLMWILTAIAVGIGGVLGAASVLMISSAHQSAPQSLTIPLRATGQPTMTTRQKTGEPSRSLTYASQRHDRVAADDRAAGARPTE